MSNNIRTKDRFTENGWFKEEYLWELRQQIVLNSFYVADYRNSFGIDEKKFATSSMATSHFSLNWRKRSTVKNSITSQLSLMSSILKKTSKAGMDASAMTVRSLRT